ncbi:hypothetical protein FQK07_11260 [Synechococcus sp. BSF8S]|jgi:hypothetical protein|uniref:hypothetical protein n=1 Tax=Synechococcales TaxID=1890424 RepID=UPI0016261354|nr:MULTISPECIES: hypothetical protein [unclassified Synechococcus]MBC1261829.1 hypothetical protein [Synechococcus sp. BSF8S]MBC1264757.1 hypothetical protein [Synechococcus sp. BSA11S]MCT0247649.1 hypothetical protein [Synechococcus sp. CS-205]
MTHSYSHPPSKHSGAGSFPTSTGVAMIANGSTLAADDGGDSVESYFECITTCSLDDGECITRCVETLREHH